MAKPKEPEPEVKEDPLVARMQESMLAMLESEGLADKDKIALYDKVIKFLLVKHKIQGGGGEDDSFFGGDD